MPAPTVYAALWLRLDLCFPGCGRSVFLMLGHKVKWLKGARRGVRKGVGKGAMLRMLLLLLAARLMPCIMCCGHWLPCKR